MATSCGELKAAFSTGLVCDAVQQGETMHRESCGDDHMPVTRGFMAFSPAVWNPASHFLFWCFKAAKILAKEF